MWVLRLRGLGFGRGSGVPKPYKDIDNDKENTTKYYDGESLNPIKTSIMIKIIPKNIMMMISIELPEPNPQSLTNIVP